MFGAEKNVGASTSEFTNYGRQGVGKYNIVAKDTIFDLKTCNNYEYGLPISEQNQCFTIVLQGFQSPFKQFHLISTAHPAHITTLPLFTHS